VLSAFTVSTRWMPGPSRRLRDTWRGQVTFAVVVSRRLPTTGHVGARPGGFSGHSGAATANSDRWRCCGQSGGLEVCRAVTHTNTARIDWIDPRRVLDNRTIKWSG